MRQPYISEDTYIAPNASIAGEVYIESNVIIMFNAVIRGDFNKVSIDEGTNIQDNCIIHCACDYPVTIGKNCTIAHTAVINGATIGDNVLIGIGAIVLDGVTIGNNCFITAKCIIKNGTQIPPNSYVRSDGTILSITDAQSEKIIQIAEKYQQLCEDYIGGNIGIYIEKSNYD